MVLQTRIFFYGWRPRKKGWFICTINSPFFRLEKSDSAKSDFFSGWRLGKKIRVWRTTFLLTSKSLLRVQIKRLIGYLAETRSCFLYNGKRVLKH